MSPTLISLAGRIRQFVSDTAGAAGQVAVGDSSGPFEALALDLFAAQWEENPVYRAFCAGRGISPETVDDVRAIPAIPVAAFKEERFTCLADSEITCEFHSSGTTGQRPSRHRHGPESLALYEASAVTGFRRHLAAGPAGGPGIRWLILTPAPEEVPHSSLVHMLAAATGSPGEARVFLGRNRGGRGWELDFEGVAAELEVACHSGIAVGVLGTAFNFVHLIDAARRDGRAWRLPAGSRVMETGGYKGRSRELSRPELHDQIVRLLGLPSSHLVTEYGMAELGSQAYDQVAGEPPACPRVLRFPPWARVWVVSPETGREVEDGESGLVRVLDLSNVASGMAVQTEDVGVRRGSGMELRGRLGNSEPRGCSLMSAPTAEEPRRW